VWRYRTALKPGQPSANDEMTVLAAAHEIHTANDRRRWEIEARMLTGADVSAISQRVGITVEVVETYVGGFFDVRDHLNARDWFWLQAVDVGSWGPPEPTEGDTWRWAAASGGPVVLDLLIGDYLNQPLPEMPDRHQLAEDIRHLVRFICAPMSDKRIFGRVLREAREVLARRAESYDKNELQLLSHYVDFLEWRAGLQPPTGRRRARNARRTREPIEDLMEAGTLQEEGGATPIPPTF
jgi:hypothetical protein